MKKGMFYTMYYVVKSYNLKRPWHVIYRFEDFDELYKRNL